MRTGLTISLVLLVVTIILGGCAEQKTSLLADRYSSAAEELRMLTQMCDWDRANMVAAAYIEDWEHTTPWLQVIINHEDIDDVTLALKRLETAIEARDASSCLVICAELKENARHIHHRDAFTLGNVL